MYANKNTKEFPRYIRLGGTTYTWLNAIKISMSNASHEIKIHNQGYTSCKTVFMRLYDIIFNKSVESINSPKTKPTIHLVSVSILLHWRSVGWNNHVLEMTSEPKRWAGFTPGKGN